MRIWLILRNCAAAMILLSCHTEPVRYSVKILIYADPGHFSFSSQFVGIVFLLLVVLLKLKRLLWKFTVSHFLNILVWEKLKVPYFQIHKHWKKTAINILKSNPLVWKYHVLISDTVFIHVHKRSCYLCTVNTFL